MGWMNDTLRYMAIDPLYRATPPQSDYVLVRVRVLRTLHAAAVARRGRARQALVARQDAGRRLAEARELSLAVGYMIGAPGQETACSWAASSVSGTSGVTTKTLPGAHLQHPHHRQLQDWNRALNRLYHNFPELHASEQSGDGFRWLEVDNAMKACSRSLRQRLPNEGGTQLVIILNATPVPRDGYVLGVLQQDAIGKSSTAMRRLSAARAMDSSSRCKRRTRLAGLACAHSP